MIRIWCVLISLLVLMPAYARQQRIVPLEQMKNKFRPYSGTYIPEFSGYCLLNDPETIDSVTLLVTYELSVTLDTLVRQDRVVAEVGRRYTQFYSLYLRELSMNHTYRNRNVVYQWMRNCSVLFPATIRVDKTRQRITNQVLLPYRDNFYYEYDEPLPDIPWIYGNDVCEIAGYHCMEAECEFRGRKWTVWYTTEIPCQFGFWKFHGLPGMILSVSDSNGEYIFTAIGIEQPSAPMIRYKIPSKRMPRERIIKAERTIYDNPLDAFFAQTGQDYFVVCLKNGMEIITRENNVSIPYNPIELE